MNGMYKTPEQSAIDRNKLFPNRSGKRVAR